MKKILLPLLLLLMPLFSTADGGLNAIGALYTIIFASVMGLVLLLSSVYLFLYNKRGKAGYFYTSLVSSSLVFFSSHINSTISKDEPIILLTMLLAFAVISILLFRKITNNPATLIWYIAEYVLFELTIDTMLSWFNIQLRVLYSADIPVMIWILFLYVRNRLIADYLLPAGTLYRNAILFGMISYVAYQIYFDMMIYVRYGNETFNTINLFYLLLYGGLYILLIPAATVFVTTRMLNSGQQNKN